MRVQTTPLSGRQQGHQPQQTAGASLGEPLYQQQMPDGSLVFVRAQPFVVQASDDQPLQPTMKEQVAKQLLVSPSKAATELRQEVERRLRTDGGKRGTRT